MSDTLRKALSHDNECPSPEALIEAVEHKAAGGESTVEHWRICPACQTELALYRGFASGTVQPHEREAVGYIIRRLRGEETVPVARRVEGSLFNTLAQFFTPVRVRHFGFAAVAILMTVGIASQWQNRQGSLRRVPEETAMRSGTLGGIEPQGDVESFPEEIRWEAVRTAAEYDVTIREVDRTVVFNNKFTRTVLQVPPELRRLMVPGKTVLLLIEARDSSGRLVAQSETTRIHVLPGAAH